MSRDSNSTGWLPLAILLCTVPHLVLAQEGETPGDQRLWVSQSRNLEQLDDEIARLYQVLEEGEALPARPYHDPHGRTLSTILWQEQLYFGADFPERNDAWLCKLNPAHCRPEEADPGSGQQTFRWINRAGDDVVLPNLSFTTGQEWILHDKQPGEDIGALIVETLGGCKTLGPGCLELLGKMNDSPETVLDPRSSGKVWLPVLRVETWLDIGHRPDVQNRLKSNLVPDLVVRPRPGEDRGGPPGFAPVPPAGESPIEGPSTQGPGTEGAATQKPSTERPVGASNPTLSSDFLAMQGSARAIDPLGLFDRVESERPVARFEGPMEGLDREIYRAVRQAELASRQQEVFRLIGLPDREELSELPFEPRVVVIDGAVDPNHCGFHKEKVRSFDLAGQRIVPEDDTPPPICGDPVRRPEHGTHVAGLIAANGSPANLRGVNPAVDLDTYAIPLGEPQIDPIRTRETFRLARRKLPQVMNLSWDYSPVGLGDADPVPAALASLETATLVVAAAGNENLENGSTCLFRPACLDLPNLLVVAALDLDPDDPDLWQDGSGHRSHWGRHKVHLAAPGHAIPSISDRHQCGELSGTSQAAPLVSGAASLLFAKYGDLEPASVRDRLVYTSRLTPRLLDRLLGGRLDVRRALDGDHDRIELRPGALVRCGERVVFLEEGGTLRGTLFNLTAGDGTSPGRSFVVRRLDDPSHSTSVEVDQLKRMVLHPWSDDEVFSLFMKPADGGPLERWEARLESAGRRLWLEILESQVPELMGYCQLELRHLADYTAPLR